MFRETTLQTDIVVAGGGMAGVCCALAAARNGADVILCQDRPVLGGNASSEIRMHIVGADCSGGRGSELETETREGGIIEEIRLENCVRNPQRSPSMFDLILYDLCYQEPNLKLLLNTAVVGCKQSSCKRSSCNQSISKITSITAENLSSENRFTIQAASFVDCTGDGALGVLAGAQYREGRESSDEFSESLAPPAADSKRLGTSLMFQARRYDTPMPFKAPLWARPFGEEDLILRPHADAVKAVDTGLEYGYWWIEWGGELDTIKENEEIRDELLAIVMGVWDHVKNGGDHGAENWALEWVGFVPGKRESRRFVGMNTLTQNDIMDARRWPDTIAYGGWPIDIHPPGGVDDVDEEPCVQHQVPYLYDIPLSICLSKSVDNLLFAGRNVSATHTAFASTRVMATAAVMGQGVGTAAAQAISVGRSISECASDPQFIRNLQQQLLRDDCFLIGISNEDTFDLARSSKVSASSQQLDGSAVNILSGSTRAVHGPNGVFQKYDNPVNSGNPNSENPCSQRWMSDPAQALPQWLELSWDKPVTISRVVIIFDTGMHRVLTLSQSDAYTAAMEWGHPQPETVKSYQVNYKQGDTWQTCAETSDNYQRKCIHITEAPIKTTALRIVVSETNGLDHARIHEVRIYAQ